MADEKLLQAQKLYAQVCDVLDKRKWKYDKDEEKFVVHFKISGEGLPISLIVVVDTERTLLQVLSPLSFKTSKEKKIELAVAACFANYDIADGSFDYDMYEDRLHYRIAAKYADSRIGDEFIEYLIDWTCTAVDTYSDKFLALSKGLIDFEGFMKCK